MKTDQTECNASDLAILQHTLGTDEHGRQITRRNHFVAGAGTQDHTTCLRLVAAGLMMAHGSSEISGGDDVFTATPAARAYVIENSLPPIKLSRSQERYKSFLSEDGGMRFGEWLKAMGRRDNRPSNGMTT